MMAGFTFEGHEVFDVFRVFDLRALVVTARVLGNNRRAIEYPHAIGSRTHRDHPLHVRVRQAVIVEIEPRAGATGRGSKP